MRSLYTFILLCALVLFNACRKDDVDKEIVDPDPVTPDLEVKVASTITGFVVDETNSPVGWATVNVGDKYIRTDEYGYFKVADVSVAKIAGLVKVTKSGYIDGYKTVIPSAGKESFVRIKLVPKKEIGTVAATSGGTITTTDGSKITLPENGVVNAVSGATYSGNVHVTASWLNPASTEDLQMNIPGDARGTDSSGHLKALKAYSTIAVELTADNGQLLQIAEGKSATISLPIPSALSAEAPATIDLWRFDTTTGLWKKEGSATKTGDAYVGNVSHFSFWEAAEGGSFVNLAVRVVDASSQPLANVPVSINIAGLPKNAGYGRFGFTDANGYISGAVFANKDLVLDILTPCAISAYSHDFSTTSVDLDLGTLTGNLGQSQVTITGTVSNCENQPVASGHVQTYDGGFYNRIAISNGNFSYTGLACTNTDVNVIVVDNANYQQNAPKTVTLHSGVNNLGALTACGTSTLGVITYTYDGVTTTIEEPTDTLGAYLATPQNIWTQIVTLSDGANNSQKMSFQFDGGMALNSQHAINDVFCNAFPSGRGYWATPIQVTITEYGKVGGFISGNFSSQMLDFGDNSLHTLSCTFRVRRNN
ncbi:carboxypeptidase-like regulatory domain-containing protein [Xanthocytophaga flava]|uniref:carboxypeptidase-like regulatory domain-containing protein n=1 Tax=Xanthocytophaga flava TaxID=3048013 RepID=UPI0028D40144|nr:astroprincin family protein [Xanthocytophaga flavus]MDJ1471769.1 hypothetical protein [Xanthocytophaga flavus]